MKKGINKIIVISFLGMGSLFANDFNLKSSGVSISYEDDNGDKQRYTIKREDISKCKGVNGGSPSVVWSGNYARADVPKECKKTFITTAGWISPINIADGIKTYGELEVIKFIKDGQTNDDLLLVDARLPDWYAVNTIPTSVNLPFKSFDPKHQDFEIVLDTAGVEFEDGEYDFSNAKTMLLYCNGTWCPQSVWAIENLLKIGYPKSKLLWYRGGMTSWKSLNLTTIKPE